MELGNSHKSHSIRSQLSINTTLKMKERMPMESDLCFDKLSWRKEEDLIKKLKSDSTLIFYTEKKKYYTL